jgi:D-tyrosyl-tRNA(Tyr) deacylase
VNRVRAVVQRVLSASVTVRDESGSEVVGRIERPGLLVYLGVTHTDGPTEVAWLARKVWELRILRGERSASEEAAPILVVSQFTLYGDAR